MADMLETVVGFFQEDGWPVNPIEGQPVVQTGFQGDSGQWTCYAQVRDDAEQFIFYSLCPVNAPEDMRPWVAEYLTRANYGLFLGNFELDFEDGEVRFKTGIDVEGDELTTALVRQVVYSNVIMMDRYLPGLLKVIYGGMSPSDAIGEIDG